MHIHVFVCTLYIFQYKVYDVEIHSKCIQHIYSQSVRRNAHPDKLCARCNCSATANIKRTNTCMLYGYIVAIDSLNSVVYNNYSAGFAYFRYTCAIHKTTSPIRRATTEHFRYCRVVVVATRSKYVGITFLLNTHTFIISTYIHIILNA